MNYTELSKVVYKNAIEKGFWHEPKSDEHCLALVITEVAEAIEADRKGKRAFVEAFKSRQEEIRNHDHLDQIECFICDFEELIKDTIEDEFADIVIRLLDLAASKSLDVYSSVQCLPRKSITENAFEFIRFLCNERDVLEYRINRAVSYMIRWSKHLGIDLEFHIEQKMKYNSMREYLHAKKY